MSSEKAVTNPIIKKKKEGFFVRNIFHIISFMVPLFLMLFAFMKLKIYPFGDQQIMVVDSWHQYFPFLNELREKLVSGDSLFYSWNIGGGANFIAVIAYYASSPLYLLSVLCPKEYLTEFMAAVTLIKIALSGLTFSIFLKGMYKREDFSTIAFSTLYALSAFAMGYYWSLMWLDCMALFPLIILGLNKLIDEGKYKLFTFSLAIALISNYYIGAFVCMFVALYYIVAYLSRYKITEWRRFFKITGRALVFSALGVAMAAIIVIPVYFALQHASASSNTFPTDVTFYKPWLDIFNDLFTGVGPNMKEMTGSVNIGCGMIAVMLFFVYAACKKINTREKIAHMTLIAFIFVSFNLNILDFILHGFHFPNELPHRYSFIFSFFLLSMAYKAYTHLKSVKSSYIGLITVGLVGYALLANKIYGEEFSQETALIAIIFTILYGTAMIIFINSKKKARNLVLAATILVIAIGEGTIASQRSILEVGSSGRASYLIGKSETELIVSDLYKEDDSFYRIENTATYTINQGALYSYRNLSQFNSSCNSRATSLMDSLGIAGNGPSNRYTYYYQTPVFNSLFNLKYIINRTGQTESEFLTNKTNRGDVFAYSYNYYLPLGIVTPSVVRSWNMNIGNAFDTQESLLQLASGYNEKVFFELPKTDVYSENIVLTDNGQSYSYTQDDPNLQPYIELTYEADKSGTVYVDVAAANAVDREISVTVTKKDGTSSNNIFNMAYSHIEQVGYCEEGDTVKVAFTLEGGSYGTFDSYLYMIDKSSFENAYAMLADETMDVTEFSSTKIKGTVTAASAGVLYTSVFYEEGWHAKIDGKKVDIIPLQESLVTLDLPEGTHEIELYYVPQGFVLGTIFTLLSLFVVAAYIIMKKLNKKVFLIDTLLSNEIKEKKIVISENFEIRDITDTEETIVPENKADGLSENQPEMPSEGSDDIKEDKPL